MPSANERRVVVARANAAASTDLPAPPMPYSTLTRSGPVSTTGSRLVDQHGLGERAGGIRARLEAGGHIGHAAVQLPGDRQGLAQHAEQLADRLVKAGVIGEVRAVQAPELWRQQGVLAESKQRIDHLGLGQGRLPLGPAVVGAHALGADHDHQALGGAHGLADLLEEGERAARHGLAVPPDVEALAAEPLVEPLDERLVVAAGVGEKEGGAIGGCGHAGRAVGRGLLEWW